MNENSNLLTKLLYKFGHYFSIILMAIFITWTYVEPNFYQEYGDGSVYLFWTFYIFPWVVIFFNLAFQFGWLKKWLW